MVEGLIWLLAGIIFIAFRRPLARIEMRVNAWGFRHYPRRLLPLLGVDREPWLRVMNLAGGLVYLAVGTVLLVRA